MELLKLALLLLLRADRCLQVERRLPFRNIRFDLEDEPELADVDLAVDPWTVFVQQMDQVRLELRAAITRRMTELWQLHGERQLS